MEATSDLQFEVHHQPDMALLSVYLEPGQKIYGEPSAMVSMDPSVSLEAGLKGGLTGSLGRAFGGESLIINTFSADESAGEVTFAPGQVGDIRHYRLEGNTLYLQRGGYLAHSDGVEVTGQWAGAKGFFSGEGLVLLKASGSGDVFFNSYGRILEIDVTDHSIVDTGYIVAFEDTLQYDVSVLPGLGLEARSRASSSAARALSAASPGGGVSGSRHAASTLS